MPDATPPHADAKTAIDAKYRVEMLQAAIHDNPLFGLELCEIERGGVSYTYDTMRYLREQHPDTDYYFIIGADMVNYLPTWKNIEQLAQMVQFVGVKRPGIPTSQQVSRSLGGCTAIGYYINGYPSPGCPRTEHSLPSSGLC